MRYEEDLNFVLAGIRTGLFPKTFERYLEQGDQAIVHKEAAYGTP